MHHLTLSNRVDLKINECVLPGTYIAEDVSGAQLLTLANGGLMSPLTETRPFDENKDWNGKKILVQRVGGFGDLIRLTPILREVKRRWPKCHIAVSSMKFYHPAIENLPYIDERLGYPVPVEIANEFSAWVFYERAIEGNPRAHKIHMTELFAEIFGLEKRPGGFFGKPLPACEDMKPDYRLTKEEATWCMVQYPRTPGVRRLCIQVGASAACRVYPMAHLNVIVDTMLKRGWEVFLLGVKGEIKGVKDRDGLKNLAEQGLSFRQSAAVINNCDCLLAPDSSLLHVAGALDVPAVGVYGPFPSELRVKYTQSIHAIQGVGKCAPCFHHAHLNNHWPKDGPCSTTRQCEVLASVQPATVIARIDRIARKFEVL